MSTDVLLCPARHVTRRLPENLTDEDRPFYQQGISYSTYDCFLKFLGRARVSAHSVAYRHGGLVNEALYADDLNAYYGWRHFFSQKFLAKQVRLDPAKSYLLATDHNSTGHFHWLTETLPRLLCAKGRSREFVLLLPDTPYTRGFGVDSLARLQISFEDIVFMKLHESYIAECLWVISKVSRSGQIADDVMVAINRALTRPSLTPARRVYVSRSRARFRKVLNEMEVTAMLRANGFEIVAAEDLSFAEQAELFGACRILVGIHGAGLANCVFMNPTGDVIELRRNEVNYAYWHLADAIGHRYSYLNGVPIPDKSIIGQGCDLRVPVRELECLVVNVGGRDRNAR